MKTFNKIKKELKARGILIIKPKATINGTQAYRVVGSESFNDAYLWTAEEIKRQAYEGGF
jgi:hypothetical protein